MTIEKFSTNKAISSVRQNLYIEAATSDNTRRAYRSDIRHFEKWGGTLPSNVQTIIAYLHEHAETLNPRTLHRRMVAIRNWHVYLGHFDPNSDPLVKKTLVGIHHVHGKPKDKAPALTLENLKKMVSYLKTKNTLQSYKDNVLVQVGFFGAFRRSELVAIRYDHIKFLNEGVEIEIPKSKIDQCRIGNVCAIPYGDEALCPVKALKRWLQESKIKGGYIFPSCREKKSSTQHIDVFGVNEMLKRVAKECGIGEPESFSGHSLRRGFATTASQNGASMASIMRQGRWNNTATVLEYIEESERFMENAVSTILFKNKGVVG